MKSESLTTDVQHTAKCQLAVEVLNSAGRVWLRVNGWSMLPSVWPGDTVLIEHVNSGEISDGDIVLFGRDRRLFVHRVINRRSETGVVTCGDAMRAPDLPVHENELLGRVVLLCRNGNPIEPKKRLSVWERLISNAVRRSEIAARIVVGVYGLVQSRQVQAAQVQAS